MDRGELSLSHVAKRARDQCTSFSTGGKFRPDYGLLLELHALTLVARSYALLIYVYIERVKHFYKTLKSKTSVVTLDTCSLQSSYRLLIQILR